MNRKFNSVVLSHGGIIALCMAAFFACSAADWIPPQVKRPEFVLPDTRYAATGVECNVYFASALDAVRPDRYAFEARSTVGVCQNERWTWTPKAEDAGRRVKVEFDAWSDEGLACCRTVTVQVASAKADPSRRITCALLGDSLTGSRYQDRLMNVVRRLPPRYALALARPVRTRTPSARTTDVPSRRSSATRAYITSTAAG